MSYCRFSSNDWSCDLYCYEDVSGGFTTHVASNRIVGEIPKVPPWNSVPVEEWFEAHRKQMDFVGNAKRENIGLPFDGAQFNDPDLKSLLKRVLGLRSCGYVVPRCAIDMIQGEIDDEIEAFKKAEKS